MNIFKYWPQGAESPVDQGKEVKNNKNTGPNTAMSEVVYVCCWAELRRELVTVTVPFLHPHKTGVPTADRTYQIQEAESGNKSE